MYPMTWAQNCVLNIYEHVSCSVSHHFNRPIHTCLMLISTLFRGHDSILFFFSPVLEHLFWLLSAPPLPDFQCLKLWEPPVGTCCLLVYMVIFYSGNSVGTQANVKKMSNCEGKATLASATLNPGRQHKKTPTNLSGQFDLRYNKTHVA